MPKARAFGLCSTVPFRDASSIAMNRSLLIGILSVLTTGLRPALSEAAHVNVIELDNQLISPVTQQYIVDAINRSESDGAVCLVIQLDTPGGLLESTRAIVKRMMNAQVPIAVYVAPSGSRAGSAGVFITLAAHVAAMAPSTNIGAAHPVMGEGGGPIKKLVRRITRAADDHPAPTHETHPPAHADSPRPPAEELVEETESDPMSEKIINDTVAWITTITKTRGRNDAWAADAVTHSVSVPETEAVKERIVDLIASDLPDLLAKMEGRQVDVRGGRVELHTAKATVVSVPMSARQEFLSTITNPNIAYLLMLLGTLGLIFEFTHPGIAFPGIAGLICVLLALYAFQTLPVSYVAVALTVLGIGLLVLEVKVVSHGVLAIGGVIALTLGGLMLSDSPDPALQVSPITVFPAVATLAAIVLFIVQRALRIQAQPVATGLPGLLNELGVASTDFTPDGKVFVHGELWNATSARSIRQGDKVRIIRVDGLTLVVDQLEGAT